MKARPLPPLEELKEFLDYNPDTGIFTWIKIPNNNRVKVSRKAGVMDSWTYYISITFKNRVYYAHRLGYYMFHGIDPLEKLVDHIDGDKSNNKINNLRLASKSENGRNRVNLSSNNTSGVIGVCWDKKAKKWKAYIMINGKTKHLGYFINKEDAIKARKEGEIKYFGDFRSKEPEKEKSICWLGVIPEDMKDELRYPTEEEIEIALYEAENLTQEEYDSMSEKELEDFHEKAKKIVKERMNE